ncbi:salicylate synthase [Yinghuangia sp. YIM S09857]|uniref:salicylate synthase n=1 Tax=Yinghuangia sp. YIM S09857 TaxID=3436929 RepID=UPI003F52D160
MPLLRRELAVSADPLELAAALAESPLGADAHVVYERNGSWLVALGTLAEVEATPHEVVVRVPDPDPESVPGAGPDEHRVAWTGSPLPAVSAALEGLRIPEWRAYGWAGFELAYVHAGMPELVGDARLLHLLLPRTEVRIDGGRAEVRSVSMRELEAAVRLLTHYQPVPRKSPEPLDVTGTDPGAYHSAVGSAIDDIRSRQLQKVILSRVVPIPHDVDLTGTYLAGRRANTPTRSFLLGLGDLRATGFSPEIVVSVDADRQVLTQPLAGTRALESDGLDEARRTDLLSDAKEIFEHAISVKVAYDEMLPLCAPDSVVVRGFMEVKERGTVQHLASAVTGRLAEHVGPWEAFAALFPAVTASGVPKPAAYRVIHRNEAHPRGLYSGAVITADHTGAIDAALVLRTVFRRGTRTWLQAGAGIVEQSTPEREFEETCEKLRSVAQHLVPAT